jgi:membrane peptidoglycan carboxypeptidase
MVSCPYMALRSPARRGPNGRSWVTPVPVRRRHPFRRLLLIAVVVAVIGLATRAYLLSVYAPGLESEARTVPARVHAGLAQENAPYTPLGSTSLDVQHAIVAIEDHRFYSHPGVDPLGIARALWVNAQNQHVDQGGSTLEEHLAKRTIVGDDRSLHDKLREIGLAWALDQEYSKGKILEMYLNAAYFGRGAYGIGEATHTYFGTDAANLTVAQSAFLASLPQAPSLYGADPRGAVIQARWHQVLDDMLKDGFITQSQWSEASRTTMQFAFAT